MSQPLLEHAPAKVNLTLHVTGRRADGYHLLDSLVVFAGIGDLIEAEPGHGLSLSIDGPFGLDLSAGADNLVLRAAGLSRADGRGAALRLRKRLPVASGIGGGSTDAAATLRLLARMWDVSLPPAEAVLGLGADVPVCLLARPARMAGIGETLTPLTLPPFWMVLANPGTAVSTGAVFGGLARRDNPPMPETSGFTDLTVFFDFVAAQRNDLEAPAITIAPIISETLAALAAQAGCRLARMSGSGATCFGLFAREQDAIRAAEALRAARPDWWIVATRGA